MILATSTYATGPHAGLAALADSPASALTPTPDADPDPSLAIRQRGLLATIRDRMGDDLSAVTLNDFCKRRDSHATPGSVGYFTIACELPPVHVSVAPADSHVPAREVTLHYPIGAGVRLNDLRKVFGPETTLRTSKTSSVFFAKQVNGKGRKIDILAHLFGKPEAMMLVLSVTFRLPT